MGLQDVLSSTCGKVLKILERKVRGRGFPQHGRLVQNAYCFLDGDFDPRKISPLHVCSIHKSGVRLAEKHLCQHGSHIRLFRDYICEHAIYESRLGVGL